MKRHRLLTPLLAAALLAPASPGSADTVTVDAREDPGDREWRRRASGFESGRLDPAPVERAIGAWEAALDASPERLETRFRLMEGLYFKGHFLERDDGLRRRIYERLVRLAEETVELASGPGREAERTRAHFWAAISWGLWGMSHGYVRAGARGVAGKIRRHARAVIDLDPEFADAGGLRLLGRLHTATPRIPLFTGWVDRERGIELLRRACRISTDDPRNPLFLAEALLEFEPGSREEAIGLLRRVAAREPAPDQIVEQSETLERARRVLRRETGGEG